MKPHDPRHPYVLKFIGCGHGVLFSQPCVDCELVGLQDEYNRAVKTIARIEARVAKLGEHIEARIETRSKQLVEHVD